MQAPQNSVIFDAVAGDNAKTMAIIAIHPLLGGEVRAGIGWVADHPARQRDEQSLLVADFFLSNQASSCSVTT